MPPKVKVKFTEAQQQAQAARKDGTSTTPPQSSEMPQPSQAPNAKKKSKKGKALEIEMNNIEEEAYDEISGQVAGRKFGSTESLIAPMLDPDKEVSDASDSGDEVPILQWPPAEDDTADVCPEEWPCTALGGNDDQMSRCSVKLTLSNKVTPCLKSDDQNYASTDYANSAQLSFTATQRHPINGQCSTFIRHREFTDYLRKSGCLRLFGTCILTVYRLKSWPPPENLMELILNAMGRGIPARKQLEDLKKLKEDYKVRLKLLTKERCQLLEKLDEYQDAAASYELLDQDEILPPRPEDSPLNMELMSETFRNMQFVEEARDEEAATELKVIVSEAAPVPNILPIPWHDKRMLQ